MQMSESEKLCLSGKNTSRYSVCLCLRLQHISICLQRLRFRSPWLFSYPISCSSYQSLKDAACRVVKLLLLALVAICRPETAHSNAQNAHPLSKINTAFRRLLKAFKIVQRYRQMMRPTSHSFSLNYKLQVKGMSA